MSEASIAIDPVCPAGRRNGAGTFMIGSHGRPHQPEDLHGKPTSTPALPEQARNSLALASGRLNFFDINPIRRIDAGIAGRAVGCLFPLPAGFLEPVE